MKTKNNNFLSNSIRTHVIWSSTASTLEEQINNWLKTHKNIIIDIKYAADPGGLTAMIIYKI